MTTTLNLTQLSPTSLRLLVACCAKALDPETRAPQSKALWQRLRHDPDWVPSPYDSSLPWPTVAAWMAAQDQAKLREWLQTHGGKEGG